MLAGEFVFRDKFHTSITDMDVEMAIQFVETTFSGVATLWGVCSPEEAKAKRTLCYNYLVAWQLASLYPTKVQGAVSSPGVPLSSKKIENVELRFATTARQGGILAMLETNVFGIMALQLIQAAPETFMLFR